MKEHDMKVNRLTEWKKRFQTQLDSTQKEVTDFRFKDRMSEAEQYIYQLSEIAKRLEDFMAEKVRINREEVLLQTGDQTPYQQIQDITQTKEPYDKLWQAAVKFHMYYDKWMNGPLLHVNAEEVEEEVRYSSNRISQTFCIG